MKYIRWFDDIDRYDLDTVGGKNANLGELKILGVNVPDGFAIVSDAYRLFWSPELHLIFNELNPHDPKSLETCAQRAQDIIFDAVWPAQLMDEIVESIGELNPLLAIRSSATNEDSPKSSFAGQYDSYLNVANKLGILEYVRSCFASIFNERAIYYHTTLGYDPTNTNMSVGIMNMVPAVSSGIIFSDELLITAAPGLGENIVQGKVEPDEYYFSRETFNINRCTVRSIPECLNDPDLLELAKLTIKIEDHWDMPMDIEWAKDGNDDKIYIVQARPITT